MSKLRFTDWAKYGLVNLYPSEGENSAKRVDATKLNALFGEAAELPALRFAAGEDSEIITSAASAIEIKPLNSYGKGGIINAGERFWAWIGDRIWRSTAYADDALRLENSVLVSGEDLVDYSQLLISELTIMVLQGGTGWKVGKEDIARGTRDGALHLDDLVISPDDTTNAAQALLGILASFDSQHKSNGEHGNQVIVEGNLHPEVLAGVATENLVAGGMELLGGEGSADGNSHYPLGWQPYNHPAAFGRNDDRSASGSFSARVVATGANQGCRTTIDASRLSNRRISISAKVYCVSDVRVCIEVSDGTTVVTGELCGASDKWSDIAFMCESAETASAVEVRFWSSKAGTFFLDDVSMIASPFTLAYAPSVDESLVGYTERNSVYGNLLGNVDFASYYQTGENILPFLWRAASVLPMTSLENKTSGLQRYGSSVWQLALQNSQSMLYEALAPNEAKARRFRGRNLIFTVDLRAADDGGDDPLEIFIEDDAGITAHAIKPDSTAYNRYSVHRLITNTATYVRVGLRNNAGSSSYCQVLVGGVQLIEGIGMRPWQPGDYLKRLVLGFGYAGTLSSGVFLKYQGVDCDSSHGPLIPGWLVGTQVQFSYSSAPSADTWRVQLLKSDNSATSFNHRVTAKLDKAFITLKPAEQDSDLRMTIQTQEVGTTPGVNPVINVELFILP